MPHRDQAAWVAGFAALMAPSAVGLLGTELVTEPANIEHWYFSPRNGHITVHTPVSLQRLFAPHGLDAVTIANGLHFVRRIR